jgi:prepilin signal peptidase PulO-like enzyme (type II secretory pathway)
MALDLFSVTFTALSKATEHDLLASKKLSDFGRSFFLPYRGKSIILSSIKNNESQTMTNQELLHNLLTVFFFVFGSLLGSFSNVVILRMSSKTSVIFPPSSCPKCGHQLHAIDLVPVFSWLFLRGKCRYCSAAISWQYPLVEATIATLIALSFYKTGLSLDYIALAGKSVIWFVACVIFIRREVLEPGPYLWPAMIFVLFNFPIGGCPFLSLPIKIAPLAALAFGAIASFRINYETFWAWAGLSFLMIFALAAGFAFLPLIPLAVISVVAAALPGNRIVERLFATMQIAAIFIAIILK